MYYIKNARLVNGDLINIYIIENKLFTNLPKEFSDLTQFQEIKLEKDTYVSYGWIDSHAHADESNELYGANIDDIGYKQGVSLIIDAGSVGIDNLERLFKQSQNALTNVKVLLNISRLGIFKQSELEDLKMIDVNYDFDKYADFVVGYKARMSSSVTINSGVNALKVFRQLPTKKPLPVMVHIGNEPPTFAEIVNYLEPGDVVTHALNFKNHSLFNKDYFPEKSLLLAKEKGVYFDLGHGTESFNYLGGKKALANGFKLDLISSDIYRTNQKNGIVSSLALTVSKMHTLGIKWEELIDLITIKPAEIFNLKGYGKIADGNFANLTVFKIIDKKKTVYDSNKNAFEIDQVIEPILSVINGKVMEINHED